MYQETAASSYAFLKKCIENNWINTFIAVYEMEEYNLKDLDRAFIYFQAEDKSDEITIYLKEKRSLYKTLKRGIVTKGP